MSISGGLSSALSGLTAASRAAEIVASNIANAMTPGYGRREVQMAARQVGSTGQGVMVTGVLRHSDPVLTGERRLAQAGSSGRETTLDFLNQIETAIGTPDSATSLAGRISDFDSALIEAGSRPESEARLVQVLQTAQSLVNHIAAAGNSIQSARAQADHSIASQVDQVKAALNGIAEINGQIRSSAGANRDVSALVDHRQQLIDSVAQIIPLREVPRENGQVALFSTGGAVLLEGTPAQLGFGATGTIVAGTTQASGGLAGLTLNGRPISTTAEGGPVSGGSLTAAFALRDVTAPQAQAELDALSRDLIERFADPAVDPTLALGAPGLFTDANGTFLPTAEPGLAQRLQVNSLVDPARGGALWRLRDGLGATTPGDVGDARLLINGQTALSATRPATSPLLATGARSFAAFSADIVATVATARVVAEREASYASSRLETLNQLEEQGGVDTDQEMQSLLLIEQAYSANAKVISTVGGMIQTLLEM